MAKGHKPVAGSRAFWPRKRAKRIYDSFGSSVKKCKEAVPLAFAGYKAGMTQISVVNSRKGSPNQGKEVFLPATVLSVPNMIVSGIKGYKKTPYGLKDVGTVIAKELSKDLSRTLTAPKKRKKSELKAEELSEVRLIVHTKPREYVGKKKPELFEITLGGDSSTALEYAKSKLGQELKPEEVFKEGEYVDTKAVTKGKGYQGPVKRFGITIRSRKNKGKRRHVGNMGAVTPARVLPGKIAQAGQMGYQTRTEVNKLVLKLGTDGLTPSGGWSNSPQLKGSYLILSGSVPGPKKRLIMIRKGVRAGPDQRVEVKQIIKDSQQ